MNFDFARDLSVLLIGIGGGGDIIGTLLTRERLLPIAREVHLMGLSWKRAEHDPAARPRRVSEFRDIEAFDSRICRVSASSTVDGGIRHVEMDVARLFPETSVWSLDITDGIREVRSSLDALCRDRGIDVVVGIDVGGDALCLGTEDSVRSPICDQVVLGSLSAFPGALLGVYGFGADGELSDADARVRLDSLVNGGAFSGGFFPSESEAKKFRELCWNAKTESSRIPIEVFERLSPHSTSLVSESLERGELDLSFLSLEGFQVVLRGGFRTGNLSALTPATLFFVPRTVWQTSQFSEWLLEEADVFELNDILVRHGCVTELTELRGSRPKVSQALKLQGP
jgi:hypothetical protein